MVSMISLQKKLRFFYVFRGTWLQNQKAGLWCDEHYKGLLSYKHPRFQSCALNTAASHLFNCNIHTHCDALTHPCPQAGMFWVGLSQVTGFTRPCHEKTSQVATNLTHQMANIFNHKQTAQTPFTVMAVEFMVNIL